MLILVVVLKTLLEVAGMALIGQGVLYLLAGGVYVTRLITPRRLVADAHITLGAFFLVAGLWLALSLVKVELCRANPEQPVCAERLAPARQADQPR